MFSFKSLVYHLKNVLLATTIIGVPIIIGIDIAKPCALLFCNFDNNLRLIDLNLMFAVFGLLLFPVEFLLHEVGHVISLLVVYKLSGVKLMKSSVGLFSIECTSLSKFKTINKISLDGLWKVRIFAMGGIAFILLLSWVLAYCFKLYLISLVYILLELVSLCNGRPTNDWNVFWHPDRF